MSILPMVGALPGNCDTWLSMAVSRGWLQTFQSWLVHGEVYSAMYPAEPAVFFGESAPAAAITFLLLDAFLPLPWAVAWLVGVFLGASAYGVYLLSRALGVSFIFALIAGLFFATSNFIFANLDDSVILFWLLPLLAARAVLLWDPTEGETPPLIFASVLLGIQLYFSVYVFVFGVIICGVLWLMRLRKLSGGKQIVWRDILREVSYSLCILAVLITPWFAFYLSVKASLEFTDPFNPRFVTLMCSLNLPDLIQALPGNLLRPIEEPQWRLYWSEVRRFAYLGIVPMGFAVVGLFKRREVRGVALAFIIVGFVLAVSPTMNDDPRTMRPLVAIIQHFVEIARFLRVPLRAYMLTGIGVAIAGAAGLEVMYGWVSRRSKFAGLFLIILLVGFHLVDNIPSTVTQFKIAKHTQAPEPIMALGEKKPNAILVQLPSQLGFDFLDSEDPVFRYSRELIYFLWQAQTGLRTINGTNGYASESRVKFDKILRKRLDKKRLQKLVELTGATHLAYHADMRLKLDAKKPSASAMSCLKRLKLSNQQTIVYKITPPCAPE